VLEYAIGAKKAWKTTKSAVRDGFGNLTQTLGT
jgi:hypothetical protein